MLHLPLYVASLVLLMTPVISAEPPRLRPDRPDAIYRAGETIGFTVSLPEGTEPGDWRYVVRADNAREVASKPLERVDGRVRIAFTFDQPSVLRIEVVPVDAPRDESRRAVAAAAVDPDQLKPVAPEPADFDAFWADQLRRMRDIPLNARITLEDQTNPGILYQQFRLDHVRNSGVHGQLARPAREGRFPALISYQWAGAPYPLDRAWVQGPAWQGWLALNIQAHDVLPSGPQSYYDQLPESIRKYERVGLGDLETTFLVEMYLRTVRAIDYLATRDDWDGRTLVVSGTSMGGMQAIIAAALDRRVTHVLACEPAGCDLLAGLHGRQTGYPYLTTDDPKINATLGYLDVIHFAPRVKVPALVGIGFLDTTTPPTGIWTMFNQLAGPRELAPMPEAAHNHISTPRQLAPFTSRNGAWLDAIRSNRPIDVSTNAYGAYDDYAHLLRRLDIRKMRPGADPANPNTFDESQAMRLMHTLPPLMRLGNGDPVDSLEAWSQRRAELVELFEREVYGRIPTGAPGVAWSIRSTRDEVIADKPVRVHELVGRVDHRGAWWFDVAIEATLTVPASSERPVPLVAIMSFGATAQDAPEWIRQAIDRGWGVAVYRPTSVQPDDHGLSIWGVVALTSRGAPREPDQWGAIRAWQWGASRLLDALIERPELGVDTERVCIAGLSRYGKAALLTLALDERFAMGFIGSSGEGGTKLHRYLFGETLENLAGGQYHWMAGNFVRYGAADPEMTVADLPVDSHQLIALCAPRPLFISHGIPEQGDAHWIGHRGSWMAALLAEPAYRLHGVTGLGVAGDPLQVPMPPVEQLVGDRIAWRQHTGGHELTPNWTSFFDWAETRFDRSR